MGESRVRGVGPDVCCHAIYAPSTASLDRLQSVAGKRDRAPVSLDRTDVYRSELLSFARRFSGDDEAHQF